jgi:hypothetical protein
MRFVLARIQRIHVLNIHLMDMTGNSQNLKIHTVLGATDAALGEGTVGGSLSGWPGILPLKCPTIQ